MNDKNRIRKEIAELIDNLKAHSDNISNSPAISSFEMELMLHKISKLYEKSVIYHFLCNNDSGAQSHVQQISDVKLPEIKSEEPVAKKEEAAIPPEVAPLVLPGVSGEIQDSRHTDLFGEKILPKEKPKKEEKERKVIPVNKIPVPDLKAAIGINDKFRYINELFHGNSQEYNVAVNQINNCNSFEEADIYITNLREIYHWKEDSQAVNSFLNLVERRFL